LPDDRRRISARQHHITAVQELSCQPTSTPGHTQL
jgi:hypothetical protein